MYKLKVFEAFSGVGSQRMALRNLGINHEVVATSEIDKFAISSYNAVHGETVNLGDISKINTEDIPDHDLFTYSFPCQDISVAGKQCGLDMGSGTRSGLLWECQKVISVKKPKYLLLENVKNLVGKRHRANFDTWLEWLESEGYSNYWKVLNAKDYGIPQNRERVFVVSILGEHEPFEFPEKQELQLRLKDVLQDEVEEKFYMSDEKVSQLLANTGGNIDFGKQVIGTCHPRNDLSFATRDRVYNQEKIAPTLTATTYKDPVKVATMPVSVKENYLQWDSSGKGYNSQNDRAYYQDGLCPALPNRNSGDKSQVVLSDKADVKRLFGMFDTEDRVRQPSIITYDVKLPVTKRVHEVDIEALQVLLRESKKLVGLSNKHIADELEIPVTKVEHWFRTDSSFAIPYKEIWHKLKKVLDIDNTLFDAQITEFEVVEGVYEQANRVYDPQGISATLTASMPHSIKIKNATKKGYIEATDGDGIDLAYPSSETRRGRVQKGMAQTLQTSDTIGTIEFPVICASRGRNPENPSDRTLGTHLEQRIEVNKNKTSNTLTTVQKDNYVLEHGPRIRKLTPLECWRLMGFSDTDFYKAQAVNSNTQLYKQAGNSIVVDVLEGIFKNMLGEEYYV